MVGHLVDDRPLRPPPHAVRVEVALRVLRVAPGPLLEPVDEALLDLQLDLGAVTRGHITFLTWVDFEVGFSYGSVF